MKILFTGASSFTGMWFVQDLARAGHEVVAILRREPSAYEGVRAERVARVADSCRLVTGCEFGDDRFMELVSGEDWDAFCHHAADVTDYHSPDFDVARALASNTRNLRAVLAALETRGCGRVVVTGSVFEQDEGAGAPDLPAFSPYGLSKAFTWEVFRHLVPQTGMQLGKFVIPNPFGPFEEPRFTSYLVRTWGKGETAGVRTPAYVRDNIHVSLLSLAYRDFVEHLESGAEPFAKSSPSGYLETQGEFAQRFGNELGKRLGIATGLELADQVEFAEPRVRTGTQPLDGAALGWSEEEAWDALANYYREHLLGG